MITLTSPPPETVTVNGRKYAINTDWRIGVAFETALQDDTLLPEEAITRALKMYYPVMPDDINEAIRQIIWFYRCGKEPEPVDDTNPHIQPKKAYDFVQDAEMLISAFWLSYRIDLTAADMHWWVFRALMRGLPQECEMTRAMMYRTADTKGMSKTEKKHYDKMRKVYALASERTAKAGINLIERNNRMIEHVNSIYKRAGITS